MLWIGVHPSMSDIVGPTDERVSDEHIQLGAGPPVYLLPAIQQFLVMIVLRIKPVFGRGADLDQQCLGVSAWTLVGHPQCHQAVLMISIEQILLVGVDTGQQRPISCGLRRRIEQQGRHRVINCKPALSKPRLSQSGTEHQKKNGHSKPGHAGSP